MVRSRGWSHLNAELTWMLVGIPLCVFAGVVWDGFQEARDIQSFLGASNNFYFLWLLPMMLLAAPRTLVRALLTQDAHRKMAAGTLFVLAWIVGGLVLNGNVAGLGDAVVPIVATLNVLVGALAWIVARRAYRAGHGAALMDALGCTLLVTGVGCTLGGVVHLMGELPDWQVFLYVDGFANLRTLGEVVMLALAAALVGWWKRPSFALFALAVLFAIVLAWSGTRAAWVGLGGMLVLGFLVWLPGWRALAGTVAIVLLGGILSTPLPTPHGTYGIGRLAYLANEASFVLEHSTNPTVDNPGDVNGSNRLQLWGWGVDRVQERPLTGHGYATMGSLERPEHAHFKHLHNLPLDLAFGLGVPAAVALTLFLLWALLSATFQARRDRLFLGPLCAGTLLATGLFAGLFLFPIAVVVGAMGLAGAGKRI